MHVIFTDGYAKKQNYKFGKMAYVLLACLQDMTVGGRSLSCLVVHICVPPK